MSDLKKDEKKKEFKEPEVKVAYLKFTAPKPKKESSTKKK